jgi:hypothetical protein
MRTGKEQRMENRKWKVDGMMKGKGRAQKIERRKWMIGFWPGQVNSLINAADVCNVPFTPSVNLCASSAQRSHQGAVMSHLLDIVKKEDYLQITFSGPFSIDAAKRSVDDMVAACRKEHCAKVLFDCRPMTGDLTVLDRFEVGQYGEGTIPQTVKIAMLGRNEQILPDRFFETVARNRGVNLLLFTEVDDALKWLKG